MYDFGFVGGFDWERLALALLHSLWIGLLLACVGRLAAGLLADRSPNGRAACDLAALAALGVSLPVLWIWLGVTPREQGAVPGVASTAVAMDVVPEGNESVASVEVTEQSSPSSRPASSLHAIENPAATSERRGVIPQLVPYWSRISLVLSLAYLAGVCVMSLRMMRAWVGAARLRRDGVWIRDPEILSLFDDQLEALALRFRPGLAMSTRLMTPVLSGVLRPVLLLPEPIVAEKNLEILKSLLRHELAHLKRGDHWGLVVQYVVETVAFYHPATWWLSHHLNEDREESCDACVLSGDVAPEVYAEALVRVAELGRRDASRGAAIYAQLGAAAQVPQLRRRLQRILGLQTDPQLGVNGSWTLAGLLVLFLSAGGLGGAAARIASPESEVKLPDNGAVLERSDEQITRTEEDIQSETPTPKNEDGRNETPLLAQAGDSGKTQSAKESPVWIGTVDDTAESKRSLGASGHAVRFERKGEPAFVRSIRLFAGRYGTPKPPNEDFRVCLLNSDRQILKELKFPYSKIDRADLKWHTLPTPPIEVPETFYVAVNFNPSQTKGIYLGLDESVSETHSLQGIAGDNLEDWPDKSDWMIRVQLGPEPPNARNVQRLSDWKAPSPSGNPFASSVEIGAGTDNSAGKQSYSGGGPVISIPVDELPEGADRENPKLVGLRIFASRYGSGFDPETTLWHVRLLDSTAKSQWRHDVPFAALGYKEKWIDVTFPQPVDVSEFLTADRRLLIGIDPESIRTKGIYFHYSKPADGEKVESKGFVPESKFFDTPERSWMIRAYFAKAED